MDKLKHNKDTIGFILLLGLGILYLYSVKLGAGAISTDETMGIILGEDIFLNGNYLMSGWNFSTGVTTIQLLWAVMACRILGYSYQTLYVIPALNYAILIGILAYIACANSNSKAQNRLLIAAFVILLTINPKSHSIMNVCTHTMIYALCIFVIYIVYKASIKVSGLVWYISIGGITGLLAAFNVTMLYYACVPMVSLGILYKVLKLGNKKQPYYLIIGGSVSVAICKAVSAIWEVIRDKKVVGAGEYFVTKENVISNLVQVFSNILYEFGIDVWGKELVCVDTLKALVGFSVIVCVIKSFMQYKKLDENKKMLVVAVMNIGLINLLAYGISSIPSYSQSTHLMELFGLCVVCASAICLGNVDLKSEIGIGKGVLLGIAIAFFALNIPDLSLKPEESDTQAITEYLQSNGYKKGFATYWETGNPMFESHMKMEIAPLTKVFDEEYPQGVVGGWQFATKDEWLEQEGQFMIIARDTGITVQEIIDVYGVPQNQVEINNCDILLYDQGITLKKSAR